MNQPSIATAIITLFIIYQLFWAVPHEPDSDNKHFRHGAYFALFIMALAYQCFSLFT
jgi:hypothetical protein